MHLCKRCFVRAIRKSNHLYSLTHCEVKKMKLVAFRGQLNLNDQQKSMIINDFTFSREADGSRVLKGQGGFSSVYEGFRMNGMNRVEVSCKQWSVFFCNFHALQIPSHAKRITLVW